MANGRNQADSYEQREISLHLRAPEKPGSSEHTDILHSSGPEHTKKATASGLSMGIFLAGYCAASQKKTAHLTPGACH